MKFTLILLLSVLSYKSVSANWFSDFAKGLKEGIEDAAKEDGEKKVHKAAQALKKDIEEHPKFKYYKVHLHKMIKKAGKEVAKWHKKFIKKHGIKPDKHADRKFHKQWKRINKWMTTLTKNDTDGNVVHGIPFAPILNTHKDQTLEANERDKAMDVFKKLALMWKEETESKANKEEKVPFFGRDEMKIQPKFEQDLKFENVKKEDAYKEPILPFKFEDEDKLMKEQALAKEIMSKKMSEDEHDKEILKGLRKEAEDMEKKAGKRLPFVEKEKEKLSKLVKSAEDKPISPEEFIEDAKKNAEDWGKNPESVISSAYADEDVAGNIKKVFEKIKNKETKPYLLAEKEIPFMNPVVSEEEHMETKKKLESAEHYQQLPIKQADLKEAEEKVIKEQKFFDEAEKKWEEEMKKKNSKIPQKIPQKKTTEEKEIDEELKEQDDVTVTPPNDGDWPTVSPMIKEEPANPEITFPFKFDEEDDSFAKKTPEEEEIHQVPVKVVEPASIFEKTNEKKGFEMMSDAVKPLFRDILDQRKFVALDNEWRKYENIMKKKLVEPLRNSRYWKKKEREFEKKHPLYEPEGYVEE